MRRLPQQLGGKTRTFGTSGFFVYDANKAVKLHGNQQMAFLVFPDSHKKRIKALFQKGLVFCCASMTSNPFEAFSDPSLGVRWSFLPFQHRATHPHRWMRYEDESMGVKMLLKELL